MRSEITLYFELTNCFYLIIYNFLTRICHLKICKINNFIPYRSQLQIGESGNSLVSCEEQEVQSTELADGRGHIDGAAHGTRGEDGAFGPRETATHLFLEVG